MTQPDKDPNQPLTEIIEEGDAALDQFLTNHTGDDDLDQLITTL